MAATPTIYTLLEAKQHYCTKQLTTLPNQTTHPVQTTKQIMLTIGRGQHGSTYGGNPVAAKVAMAALNVIKDEKLVENAARLGPIQRKELSSWNNPLIEGVRGRGLLNAMIINESHGIKAWDICLKMMTKGLLTKPTHGNIIRLAPPLVIKEEEMMDALQVIKQSLEECLSEKKK